MGGANAANLSEFSPLAGRSVTGWPDNDEAGHGYINDIAARATHAGASVKIVTVPPGLPPKWDIADDLPAGYTPEQMFEALRSAAPWQAPQPTDHEREDAELRQVSEMYPLPALDRPLSYARTATGEIWAHKEIEKKEGPEVLPVISPFTITARLRRIGARREAYSLRVRFQNRDGKSSEVDVPCGALAAMNGRNVMVELLDAAHQR